MDRETGDSVERGTYLLEGGTLEGFRKQVIDFNILEVIAATTGYMGGDSGHGGKTVVMFQDLSGTDISVRKIPPDCSGNGGVEIILKGDAELRTMITALKFAAESLEKVIQRKEGSKSK